MTLKMPGATTLVCLLLTAMAGALSAQGLEPKVKAEPGEWKAEYSQLEKWAASIKSIDCTFVMSRFTRTTSRLFQHKVWQDKVKEHPGVAVPVPEDSNEVYVGRYVADRIRWRYDRNRLYPQTGRDFDQYLYDGEKYVHVDEKIPWSTISGHDAFSASTPFNTLDSDEWHGQGPIATLKTIEFEKTGEESVAGRKCLAFRHLLADNKGQILAWVDAQNPLLLRRKEIFHPTPIRTNISIIEWSDVREVDGVLVPFSCKAELYEKNKQGVLEWHQTHVFQMRTCKVNRPLVQSPFDDILRIGTDLADGINDPDEVNKVGGNASVEIEAVVQGTPPTPMEPNALVQGRVDGVPPDATKPDETKPGKE